MSEETLTVQQQVKTATRAYRAPEWLKYYQIVLSTNVYKVLERTEYQNVQITRVQEFNKQCTRV